MSDSRLRDLERRWKETGRTDDEAAFLRECLKAGRVESQQLEIAAYVGHAAAARSLGTTEQRWDESLSERKLQRWLEGMHRFGKEWCVRAAFSACLFTLPAWKQHPSRMSEELALARRAIDLVSAWLLGDRGLETNEAAWQLYDELYEVCSFGQVTLLVSAIPEEEKTAVHRATNSIMSSAWRMEPARVRVPIYDGVVKHALGPEHVEPRCLIPVSTDNPFKALEQALHRSGAVADELALLRERLRLGDLVKGKIQLAACLGHEASMLLWEEAWPKEPVELLAAKSGTKAWLRELKQLGRDVFFAATQGVARLAENGEDYSTRLPATVKECDVILRALGRGVTQASVSEAVADHLIPLVLSSAVQCVGYNSYLT